jgi:hypothetical protein
MRWMLGGCLCLEPSRSNDHTVVMQSCAAIMDLVGIPLRTYDIAWVL